MAKNAEYEFAWDFINSTGRSLFLTGRAGTGKTTFLHNLRERSLKRMIVVAPTGVAAINAKGVTIHSFFQLPFGPILPNDSFENSKSLNRKFNKEKINIIRSLDLLVIDEISMVRADLLDGIDRVLRRYRNQDSVFGGVQILMIGDLQQLAPVVRPQEWLLLKPFYTNAFFFSSQAFQSCNPITIELQKIYRQDDPEFIQILNEIRTNTLSETSANKLNTRYKPEFKPNSDDAYIWLTTHNSRAEQTNDEALKDLKAKVYSYKAKIEGKFPENSYPNAPVLHLKVGAQVMFIKNDSSIEKRYFNGKIGKVVSLDKDYIKVKCPGDPEEIEVNLEVWDNISYAVNPKTNELTETNIGSYTQMPLRLAWAITIHKSQGLTFEKAIIDAQGAFAHGQTYVALSRCKSLEGLVLHSKIQSNDIINDAEVLTFLESKEKNKPDVSDLSQAKVQFQLNLIKEVFDFYPFTRSIQRLLDIYYMNRSVIIGDFDLQLLAVKDKVTELLKVANAFNAQLQTLVSLNSLPEDDKNIQQRFLKALNYFNAQFEEYIVSPFYAIKYATDNSAIESAIEKQLEVFEETLNTKNIFFKNFNSGFKVQLFLELRIKAVFQLEKKVKVKRNSTAMSMTNAELASMLQTLRNTIAQENDLKHFQVFTQKSLFDLCDNLPRNAKELAEIDGFGKVRIDKYGEDILALINQYCEANNIKDSSAPQLSLKEPKVSSKAGRSVGSSAKLSLDLFKTGKSIDSIALERDLSPGTIFGHLSDFVLSGELEITKLINKSHYDELRSIIPKLEFENLSDLKRQIDDKFEYNEIRLVLNHMK